MSDFTIIPTHKARARQAFARTEFEMALAGQGHLLVPELADKWWPLTKQGVKP